MCIVQCCPCALFAGTALANIAQMATGPLKDANMVLEYRTPIDPGLQQDAAAAAAAGPNSAWILVLSSVAMLLLALQFAGNGAGVDAKWRTNEAGFGLTALVVFDDEGHAWPVAFMLHNVENYWTTRVLIEAVQRNMPCQCGTCPHNFKCRSLERGGFYLSRCPDAPATDSAFAFIMCDKLGCQVAALRKNSFGRIVILLCQFHVMQAMLGKLEELGVRNATTLYILLMAIKMIRQSRTVTIAHARFECMCRLLPAIITNAVTCKAFIEYFRDNWMAQHWLLTWVDAGRILAAISSVVTTGNSVERLWIDVIRHVCNGKQFKRIDDLVAKLTGFTAAGDCTVTPSYFLMLSYRRRDKKLLQQRKEQGIRARKRRVPTDCLMRFHLGLLLLHQVC